MITIAQANGTVTTPDTIFANASTVVSAAPICQVNSPLPPAGTKVILQLVIPGLWPFDAAYVITAVDTPMTVMLALANIINSGAGFPDDQKAMAAAGVFAVPADGNPLLSVTNPAAGPVILQDVSPTGPAFTIEAGSAAWDSGPNLAVRKGECVDSAGNPTGVGGVPPPNGSNLVQVIIEAASQSNPKIFKQYFTIGVNSTGDGTAELALYTANTSVLVATLGESGLVVLGKKLA